MIVRCEWITCRHNSKNQDYLKKGAYELENYLGECKCDGEVVLKEDLRNGDNEEVEGLNCVTYQPSFKNY